MNFIESFSNKTILIPLLQRDYVQGSRILLLSALSLMLCWGKVVT